MSSPSPPPPFPGKRFAPATERNREPIAAALSDVLPRDGLVLEVASGTGEHACWFAGRFPNLRWQPTDSDEEALQSIEAWRRDSARPNLLTPLRLDAAAPDWPSVAPDAILCINMVHISPWTATVGLLRAAGRLLAPGAPLILYGPYRRGGVPTAASNEAFDASLKVRNPEWGLREVERVEAEAAANGLTLDRLFEMPANNLTLVFRREPLAVVH